MTTDQRTEPITDARLDEIEADWLHLRQNRDTLTSDWDDVDEGIRALVAALRRERAVMREAVEALRWYGNVLPSGVSRAVEGAEDDPRWNQEGVQRCSTIRALVALADVGQQEEG